MSINKAVGPDGLLAESVVRYSGDIIKWVLVLKALQAYES